MKQAANGISRLLFCLAALCATIAATAHGQVGEERDIPEVLRPWKGWVTWGDTQRNCPSQFNAADKRICFWPSKLTLAVEQTKAYWSIDIQAFDETWVPLPGNSEAWPLSVMVDKKPAVVLARDNKPCVKLTVGQHQISGEFQWTEMPQRLTLPNEIGILSLTIDGKAIDVPNWDAEGNVWLKRQRAEAAAKDFLAARVYRVIEDGVPMWLRTEVELTVSGKSREESLGWILPDGWLLSYAESQIPVAVDPQGRLKAQVRAGKWTIAIDAFRTTDAKTFRYAAGAKPTAEVELIGWQAQPSFRTVELADIQPIDVTQTTFPTKWRSATVYEWKTNTPFKLVEKMRGMGESKEPKLEITRRLWLDDDGRGLTYHDTINGQIRQIQRLDAAAGTELGAVRIDGVSQLVTTDPGSKARGVEIRDRNLKLDAIGRMARTPEFSATGWAASAQPLRLTLILPPGWRAFALFGADKVQGDWLSAWDLLDLFLLLIFALAVARLWGLRAGIVALLAFGLSYHEMGAPRYTWLFLLMPLALLRVVPAGKGRQWMTAWKYLALLILAMCLVPFVMHQIQTGIYPQLETPGIPYQQRTMFPVIEAAYESGTKDLAGSSEWGSYAARSVQSSSLGRVDKTDNLNYDPNAKIQTGPAEPAWMWNRVECQWNGPVTEKDTIQPILISLFWHRVITAVRVVLLVVLVSILLSGPGAQLFGLHKVFGLFTKRTAKAAAMLLLLLMPAQLLGQNANGPTAPIPDKQMLDTLRNRLLEPSDAFPNAAQIPTAKLEARGNRVTVETEIHAALDVAVPLPGRLPTWSPISVKLDGKQDGVIVCRREGYLWVNVPKGIHKVVVEGLLADGAEWEWTFLLKPRRVQIDAPDWTVTGVRTNGVPEQQVFLAPKQRAAESEAAYDRKDFAPIVAVQRQIEAGLVWKVRTTVTRLSSAGKAVSLTLPLLPGEGVLTSNVAVQGNQIDVRMAAGETKFQWESELPITPTIQLTAAKTDQWVERWQLVASAVWNVQVAGLEPIFDSQSPGAAANSSVSDPQPQMLIPTWQPWPGEEVKLTLTPPQAVSGDTVTVQNVRHEVSLGDRERTSKLNLNLECSLGSDFVMEINPEAKIKTLMLKTQQESRPLPVRRDGNKLIVSTQFGRQEIEAEWQTHQELQTTAQVERIALPVPAANVTTVMNVPESRWVLWARGPQRGPAVRFWAVLVTAIVAGLALGSTSLSPLRRLEWVLLAIGLTQIHIVPALIVAAWLFLLARRGKKDTAMVVPWRFDLGQVALVLLTLVSLIILVFVAGQGLLGRPEMFIVGNNSTQTMLQWFQPRTGTELPQPYVVSISIWFYRYAMLAWALWLAIALLRWLRWGWQQFTHGGGWKPLLNKPMPPPVMAEVV